MEDHSVRFQSKHDAYDVVNHSIEFDFAKLLEMLSSTGSRNSLDLNQKKSSFQSSRKINKMFQSADHNEIVKGGSGSGLGHVYEDGHEYVSEFGSEWKSRIHQIGQRVERNPSVTRNQLNQAYSNVKNEKSLKGVSTSTLYQNKLRGGNSKSNLAIISNAMPTPGMETRSRTLSSTTANSSSSSSSFFHSSNSYKSSQKTPSTSKSVIEAYTNLISTKNKTSQEQRASLSQLRLLILKHGVPSLQTRHGTLRATLWKLLLCVYKVDAVEYTGLIGRGPCPVWEKIENDVFRTLATDTEFSSMVSQDMISRVLHAFCWKSLEQPKSRLVNLSFSYVQGMNVLAAPFLYVMPELEAFACFTSFLTHSCPLYVQPALEGVHCGVKLLDILLLHYHPNLHAHLTKLGASCQVFAFPWILTFSACTPPLHEILQLWDYYIAYGFHLHIFVLLSLLISMRTELLTSSSPMKILQKGPKIDARHLIHQTLDLIPTCPEELFEMIVRHTYDPSVYEQIMEL